MARDDALSVRSVDIDDRPIRVLDVGTGTGIWAIHVCEEGGLRRDATQPGILRPRRRPEQVPEVMAVDLNRIQPA